MQLGDVANTLIYAGIKTIKLLGHIIPTPKVKNTKNTATLFKSQYEL